MTIASIYAEKLQSIKVLYDVLITRGFGEGVTSPTVNNINDVLAAFGKTAGTPLDQLLSIAKVSRKNPCLLNTMLQTGGGSPEWLVCYATDWFVVDCVTRFLQRCYTICNNAVTGNNDDLLDVNPLHPPDSNRFVTAVYEFTVNKVTSSLAPALVPILTAFVTSGKGAYDTAKEAIRFSSLSARGGDRVRVRVARERDSEAVNARAQRAHETAARKAEEAAEADRRARELEAMRQAELLPHERAFLSLEALLRETARAPLGESAWQAQERQRAYEVRVRAQEAAVRVWGEIEDTFFGDEF
jgi:hypothetical protein